MVPVKICPVLKGRFYWFIKEMVDRTTKKVEHTM